MNEIKTYWKGENRLIHGDNLQVAQMLLDEGIKVDLIYIDPPYCCDIDKKFGMEDWRKIVTEPNEIDEIFNTERMFKNDKGSLNYLRWLYPRLVLMRELLSEQGSIYVHIDWHIGQYVKLLLDDVFGKENFRNEIIWRYSGWNKRNLTYFNRRHDNILYYSKTPNVSFDPYKEQWESKEDYVRQRKQKVLIDESGREYVLSDGGNGTRVKRFLDEAMSEGRHIDDVWMIDKINNSDKQAVGYGTQKPIRLLERIIESNSKPNSLVLDLFGGSGTTAAVADRLGRRWITTDISEKAIEVCKKRLNIE